MGDVVVGDVDGFESWANELLLWAPNQPVIVERLTAGQTWPVVVPCQFPVGALRMLRADQAGQLIVGTPPGRGHVVEVVTGPQARANIDVLAQKYLGTDYPDEWIFSERAILKIAPDSQIVFSRGMHDIRR